jgi:hypothetical protein
MDAASSRSFNTKRDEPVRQGRRTEAGTRRLFATARSWSDYKDTGNPIMAVAGAAAPRCPSPPVPVSLGSRSLARWRVRAAGELVTRGLQSDGCRIMDARPRPQFFLPPLGP